MGKKVDGAYESLIQGVSQQAPVDRVPGQCELLENFSCDPEKGLIRRQPTELKATLLPVSDTKTTWYNILLNNQETLLAVQGAKAYAGVIDRTRAVASMAPVELSGSAMSYITAPGNLEVMSIDNKVYITNTAVVTEMLPDKRVYVQNSGLVFLLGGQYGRTYSLTIKLGDATYTISYETPNGSQASHINDISTVAIATKLTDALYNNEQTRQTLFFERQSDVILITPQDPNAGKLSITVEDGDGAANIFAVTDTVGDVGRLPRFAPNGYLVRVEGAAGDSADDYYLEFSQDVPGFGNEGYWIECVAPDVEYKFNLATMPHQLVLDGGQYRIEPGEWKDRQVGDDETNPVPSFIGSTINDIVMFQGRLVFLSGCNVIMSRTNRYTDFWANSATVLVDSDPIDISSASARSTPVFRYAVPHNRDLVIFSEFAQFIVFGRNALTPANTSLVLTTTYEAEMNTSPVAAGKNVFYPINYGRFTGIKEFYTEGSTDINASRPITAHCTQYLDGKVSLLTTSTTFDLLLVQTQTSKRRLYAYEYVWLGDEKAQSAWSTWTFPWDIEHVFFMENEIMFVYRLDNMFYLGRMDLARVDDTEYYQVNLDSKVSVTDVHTEVSLPYSHDNIKLIQGGGCPNPGLEAPVESIDGTVARLHRDMLGGAVIVGIPYMSRFVPTKPIIRDQNGIPVGTGRLMVFTYKLTCTDTGAFDAVVSSPWHEDSVTYFSGRYLNSTYNRVGVPALESGTYEIPFMNDVDYATLEIRSDYPTPLRINRLEWKGDYIKAGTRM